MLFIKTFDRTIPAKDRILPRDLLLQPVYKGDLVDENRTIAARNMEEI